MKLSLAAKNYIFTSPSVPSLSIRIASISTTTCLSNHTNTTEVPVNVPEPEISSKNVAQFRKGPGGRASFSGNVVTVFGFTGFSGRAVVNRLAKQGCQLILPYRCDPYFVKENKVVGELGQILFFPFELKDETSIRKAVKYSNVVINMIGAFINTPNYSMHDANAKGAAKLARICREMGVERFIHVSALGADPEHKTKYLKNGQFLRSKGLGELAVRETFPEATIVRPAVMYGQMDHFIHKMTTYFRRCPILGYIYVYNRGNGTYKMPTYVNDFALAIARIATDPAMSAKTFELVGPYCYEFSELVDFIYAKAGCRDEILVRARRIRFPDPWYWLMAAISALNTKVHRVRGSRINWEWLDYVEATSDVLSGGNTLGYKELGITPQNFENMGAWYAFHRRFSGQFDSTVVQLPDPPLPLRSPPLYKPRPQHSGLDKIHTERRVFGMGTA